MSYPMYDDLHSQVDQINLNFRITIISKFVMVSMSLQITGLSRQDLGCFCEKSQDAKHQYMV